MSEAWRTLVQAAIDASETLAILATTAAPGGTYDIIDARIARAEADALVLVEEYDTAEVETCLPYARLVHLRLDIYGHEVPPEDGEPPAGAPEPAPAPRPDQTALAPEMLPRYDTGDGGYLAVELVQEYQGRPYYQVMRYTATGGVQNVRRWLALDEATTAMRRTGGFYAGRHRIYRAGRQAAADGLPREPPYADHRTTRNTVTFSRGCIRDWLNGYDSYTKEGTP